MKSQSILLGCLLLPSLAAGLSLGGRVTAEGIPVGDVQVRLLADPNALAEPPNPQTRTNTQGYFAIDASADAAWAVHLKAPGKAPLMLILPTLKGTLELPTAELQPDMGLQIQLENPAKEPIPAARVCTWPIVSRSKAVVPWEPQVGVWARPRACARTDDQGRLRIPVSEQALALEATAPGYRAATLRIDAKADQDTMRLVLEEIHRARGQVLDPYGEPVADVAIRLYPWREGLPTRSRRGPESPPPSFLSDKEGRFLIPDAAPGIYDLEVEAEDFPLVTLPGLEIFDREETDLGTLHLAAGVALDGRVIDRDGQPIDGAAIYVARQIPYETQWMERASPDAWSDSEGVFTLGGLLAERRVHLGVRRSGYAPTNILSISAQSPEPVEILLRPTSQIIGRVVDERGRAIAGVRIESQSALHIRRQAQSDDGGHFTLTDVPPGKVELTAGAEGYEPLHLNSLEVPADAPLDDVKFVLRPGATIFGVVTNAAQIPQSKVRLMIGQPPLQLVDTEEDGTYRVQGIPPGRHPLMARHENFQPTSSVLEIADDLDAEAEPRRFDIVLRERPGVEVLGRIVGPDNEPVGEARVRLGPSSAMTAADGTFELRAVPPGLHTLTAEKNGYAKARLPGIEVGSVVRRGLELALHRGTTLQGTLHGLEFDDLAKVWITAVRPGESLPGAANAQGRYRITHLSPGFWTLRAWVGAERHKSKTFTISEGEAEVEMDLDFSTGVALSGTVWKGGSPLSGANIQVLLAGTAARTGTTTSPDGSFRLEGLETGLYELSVRGEGNVRLYDERIELETEEHLTIELDTMHLAGTLHDEATGAPLVGSALRLLVIEGRRAKWIAGARSDTEGRFEFGELPPGNYTLRVRHSGYTALEEALEVWKDSPFLALEMKAADELTFSVALTQGGFPQTVLVVLARDGRTLMGQRLHPTSDGRVRLTEVPPDVHELHLASLQSGTLVVPISAPGDLGHLILPPGGSLDIQVPDLMESPAEAEVELIGPGGPHRGLGWGLGGVRLVEKPFLQVGRAQAWGLAAGRWTVLVRATDSRTWAATVNLQSGEQAVLLPKSK